MLALQQHIFIIIIFQEAFELFLHSGRSIRREDVLLDIGCGDGAVCLYAANRFGLKCFGIDIHEGLLAIANDRAKQQQLDSLCQFLFKSFSDSDFAFENVCGTAAAANIVVVYLIPEATALIREQLTRYLRNTTTQVFVLSVCFMLYNWNPIARSSNVFLYNVTSVR